MLGELVAVVVVLAHDDVFRFVRIDVFEAGVGLIFLVARDIGLILRADFGLLGSSLAQYMSTNGMRKCTLGVSALALVGIVRAFEHMTLVTVVVRTITETRKGSTDRS